MDYLRILTNEPSELAQPVKLRVSLASVHESTVRSFIQHHCTDYRFQTFDYIGSLLAHKQPCYALDFDSTDAEDWSSLLGQY